MSRFCTTFDLVNPSETIRDLKYNLETVATSENIKISKMGTYHVQGIHALCPREVLQEQFEKHGEVVDIFNTGKGSAIVKMSEEAEVRNSERISYLLLILLFSFTNLSKIYFN